MKFPTLNKINLISGYHNQSVVISNNKTTIMVDGKKIDPESPEGKKILKNVEKDTKEFEKKMEKFSQEMGRI